ncbi:hypothetical protein [Cytobacillus sp. BC1816]
MRLVPFRKSQQQLMALINKNSAFQDESAAVNGAYGRELSQLPQK